MEMGNDRNYQSRYQIPGVVTASRPPCAEVARCETPPNPPNPLILGSLGSAQVCRPSRAMARYCEEIWNVQMMRNKVN